jgi:hypothetical protein
LPAYTFVQGLQNQLAGSSHLWQDKRLRLAEQEKEEKEQIWEKILALHLVRRKSAENDRKSSDLRSKYIKSIIYLKKYT